MRTGIEGDRRTGQWVAAAMILLALGAGAGSAAQITAEAAPQFAGYLDYDVATGVSTWRPAGTEAPEAILDVYSNVASAANFGFSSTDLTAVWGDRITTLGPIWLDAGSFTVFNSGSSAGPLTSATVTLSFYPGTSPLPPTTPIAQLNFNATFGGGLNPGFFTILNFTGVSVLNAILTTQDLLVTQTISAPVGGATRLGIASLNPVVVGSSIPEMYIQASTVGGGVAAYYVITSGGVPVPAHPGYRINGMELADVGVVKSDGTLNAVPGTNTVYQITATNNGPAAAPAAVVTDTFPAACTSVTWTCSGAGGGVCPAPNGSGNLNATVNLPAAGSVLFAATCAINPTATGSLTNTANVAAGPLLLDTVPANDASTDTDNLVPTANVGITKSDGTSTAVPGTNTVWSIVAANAGPSAAPAAQVTDTFPAACTSVTWTCAGAAGGVCPAPNGSGNINATVNLPVGGSVTYLATCAISVAATGNLVNTANVAAGAGVTDPNTGDNAATDIDTLSPTADVSVAKSVDPTAVDVGDTLTYTIVVANAGPSAATGVAVTDNFPAECQADLAWTCTPAGGATCTPAGVGNIADLVDLPVGSNVTYVATCTAYSGVDADVVNTASAAVAAGTIDPDPANSSASATVSINAFVTEEIPTLGKTGLAAFLLLIGLAGWIAIRRGH